MQGTSRQLCQVKGVGAAGLSHTKTRGMMPGKASGCGKRHIHRWVCYSGQFTKRLEELLLSGVRRRAGPGHCEAALSLGSSASAGPGTLEVAQTGAVGAFASPEW